MYWGTCTQYSRGHLKILGARSVTWIRFNTEDIQILGYALQSLVTVVT